MKEGIHPEYHQVVFVDVSCDFKVLGRSTLTSKETIEWEDGNTYPMIKVEQSSASHPFYTGKSKAIANKGQIERFNQRYNLKSNTES
jgi:large subunit ribosomal protein L31